MPASESPTVKVERRRHYRLSADLDAAMQVALVLAHGTEHAGEVVDLSASGISLRWPIARMVIIDVGQEVELRVQPYTREESFTALVAARWREPDDSGMVRYGFEFEQTADHPDEAAMALSRLFDRRCQP